jgi:hypothetical protein
MFMQVIFRMEFKFLLEKTISIKKDFEKNLLLCDKKIIMCEKNTCLCAKKIFCVFWKHRVKVSASCVQKFFLCEKNTFLCDFEVDPY